MEILMVKTIKLKDILTKMAEKDQKWLKMIKNG